MFAPSTRTLPATIALAALVLASLVPQRSLGAQATQAEWTIMVYMSGDNNLEQFALEDFYEMVNAPSTDAINVVVQMDRSDSHFVWPQPERDWSQTLRFKIKSGMHPMPEFAVADLGEANMGDPTILNDFVTWVHASYPAKKYFLVIWGHGEGWRFEDGLPFPMIGSDRDRYVASRRSALRPEFQSFLGGLADKSLPNVLQSVHTIDATFPPLDRVIPGTVRYVASDDQSKDKLYNREIQDVLQAGGVKYDVVGFDACLMGMMETAFALRNASGYMVGSEELEPGAGWDYKRLLSSISANPQMSPLQMSQVVVEAYRQTYQSAASDTTLSAIDLAKLPAAADAVSALSVHLVSGLADNLANIVAARGATASYAPAYGMHGIDLIRFVQQLLARDPSTTVRTLGQQVIDSARRSVVANYAGSGRRGAYGSNGIAIYFPKSKFDFDNDEDKDGYIEGNTRHAVEFVQQHHWDNFLMDYFALVP